MPDDVAKLVLLSVLNWLHLVAVVVWIGGMVTNYLTLLPSARESLEPPVMGRLMGSMMRRSRRLVYASIIVLLVVGVIMMLLNKEYLGLLDFGSFWSAVLLIKHIFIGILVIVVIYVFEVLAPKVGRVAAKGPSPELAQLQKLQQRVGIAGLIVASIVLLLTAVITAVSALP